ncbi:MAG: hypothetical protein JOZ00_24000 [Mycobacterium sp.]|uniref:hypothetical protein n=1 Tax=Mycobacterium sp. TaxID=1785 RepID=UPI001EB63EDF|nr:hypothetical protein [Mycobacterium sp.]MBV8789729.1 hypothetical protein [Mycobacterium sp.]
MAAADDDATGHGPDSGAAGADPPLTVDLIADLQAGLLDDEAAARVRRQVRADPEAAVVLNALNQVRSDVGAVGAATAPDAPPRVTARVTAALADEPPGGAHSARPRSRPLRTTAAVGGFCAVLAAVGFGTIALLRAPDPTPSSTSVTAEHITVSPPTVIPLSQEEILGLLDRTPDYGPFADPARRASCLSGLGYPASTPVLGARPIEINARPGVLLVVAGDTPHGVAAYAVALNCSAADTGLLANTQIPRP